MKHTRHNRFLFLGAALMLLALAPMTVWAHTDVFLGIHFGGLLRPAPVVVYAPPAYYRPAPTYYAPPPVYYAPRRIYYAPRPIYFGSAAIGYGRRRWDRDEGRHHGWDRGDRDDHHWNHDHDREHDGGD